MANGRRCTSGLLDKLTKWGIIIIVRDLGLHDQLDMLISSRVFLSVGKLGGRH